jgi:hypothetical protein
VGPDEEAETTDENDRTRTVAEDVSGVPGCQPRSQENLRLRPQFIRIKILTDNRESRQMLQTLLWIIPLILAIGSQIVLSRYFRLWKIVLVIDEAVSESVADITLDALITAMQRAR